MIFMFCRALNAKFITRFEHSLMEDSCWREEKAGVCREFRERLGYSNNRKEGEEWVLSGCIMDPTPVLGMVELRTRIPLTPIYPYLKKGLYICLFQGPVYHLIPWNSGL